MRPLALLLALLAGCDRSTTVTWTAGGTVNVNVADGGTLPPPADPADPVTPPPPPVAGWDVNTNAALLEAFDKQLDPIGEPDQVSLGPFGVEWTWFPDEKTVKGFERSNSCYRWTAALVAPADGEYEFTAKVKSGGSLAFNGETVWAVDREQDATSNSDGFVVAFKRTLERGKLYPIRGHVSYQGFLYGYTLDWKRPDREAPERVSAAFLHPPADWESRLKKYAPAPPEPPAYDLPDASYQSPDLAEGLFPADHFWNTRIDEEPIDPLSDKIIARLGGIRLHPVFGQNGVGIPFELVPADAPKISIAFAYSAESDPGPYPLPERPLVEFPGSHAGGDGHWIGIDRAGGKLYELFLVRKEGGLWKADSGAIFDLATGERVPGWKPGWTSGDAAGLAIAPGLVRHDEFIRGQITHAIRVSVPATRSAFVAPATHMTHTNDPTRKADDLPPMGCRLRLKASVDESTFPASVRPIVRAAKRYGLVVADNGGPFVGVCGVPDARWRDDELASLKTILSGSLEVVKMPAITTEVP